MRAGGERLYIGEVAAGFPLSIRFIHSVQKTPVEEYLAVDEARQGFLLTATKYQSFGVGLPFDAAEGEFHQEGDYFWLRGQERRYPKLALRVGVGTELTLSLAGKKFPLYEKYHDEGSPAIEPIERVRARYAVENRKYYFVMMDGARVGAINIGHNDPNEKKVSFISPLFIHVLFQL